MFVRFNPKLFLTFRSYYKILWHKLDVFCNSSPNDARHILSQTDVVCVLFLKGRKCSTKCDKMKIIVIKGSAHALKISSLPYLFSKTMTTFL